MKRYYFLIIMIFSVLCASPVHAQDQHELKDLDIHVFIHEDGSATFTEVRQMIVSEGTEGYEKKENLSESKIIDFKAWRDGEPYTFEEDWDSDWSLERKAGHHGIIETNKGYELVWGLGDYGEHEYKIQYTVSDFIKELDDAQIIYWHFVSGPTNVPPQKVRIEIESEKDFSTSDERIWAYGYNGSVHFKDGKIVAESDKPLNGKENVIILSKLEKGLFNTKDKIDKSFNKIKKEADGDGPGVWVFIVVVIPLLIFLLYIVPKTIGFIIRLIVNPIRRLYYFRKPKVKYPEESLNKIPYDGHFTRIYALLKDEKLSNIYYITSALVMKWFVQERIELTKVERKWLFLFKRKREGFKINDRDTSEKGSDMNHVERQLFNRLISAAKHKNSTFTMKELKKDLKKHGEYMSALKDKFYDYSIHDMEKDGLIVIDKKRQENILRTKSKYHLTDAGEQLKKDIYLFMNFARDFAKNKDTHQFSEEEIKDFFVWSSYLGLMEEFNKQIKLADVQASFSLLDGHYHLYRGAIFNISTSVSSSGGGSGFGGAAGSGGGGAFGGGGGGTR